MRRKLYLLIVAATLLLASCGKDPIPGEDPVDEPVRFSVLGDSYSTFVGYVDPESNDVWYDTMPNNHTDVTSVEQMWWYKVANEMGWVMDKNNSFSGALICNFWGYNSGSYYRHHSFIRRMDNLGDPDVILVFGGINDVVHGAYSGEFVYSDWTEGQLENYRPALAYLFDGLKRLYPTAKVYFMVDMWLYDYDPEGQRFVESVHTIARHYGIGCFDLYDIQKSWGHPSAQGMVDIATQVVSALMEAA